MSHSRRTFLKAAAAASLGFAGLARRLAAQSVGRGFGPLIEDPDGLLDLPEGFSYRVLSRAGDVMDDGFRVPYRHDGMAAFPGPDGTTLLVRNHEGETNASPEDGFFGRSNELLPLFEVDHLYDPGRDGRGPAPGGTTNLVFDTAEQRLVEHRLSLAGTLRNCAGGPTPWGSWLTCEESVRRAGGRFDRDHGFLFEVPAVMPPILSPPEPLVAMGRFYREAVAVHPDAGVVYQTEDRDDGLLYRFIPEVPGHLREGGRLQALALLDRPGVDTRNWGSRLPFFRGARVPVRWIDVDDPENPDDDLRDRGAERGAARFARAEGIWYATDGVYIACTNGGAARRGQIWRYVPSPLEGTADESSSPPELELFLEADRSSLLRRADNLTMAPWGDLVVCEDGSGTDGLVGVTPGGGQYPIARNAAGNGEMAGSTFSPDGTTLFANMQIQGLTIAITGPWERRESR